MGASLGWQMKSLSLEEWCFEVGSAVTRAGRGHSHGHERGRQIVNETVSHDDCLRFGIAPHVACKHPSWRIWPGRGGTGTVYGCRGHVLVLVSEVTTGGENEGIIMRVVYRAAYLSVHVVPNSP